MALPPISRFFSLPFGRPRSAESVFSAREILAEILPSFDAPNAPSLNGHRAELLSLAAETNSQFFFETLESLANRLEAEGCTEASAVLFAAIQRDAAPSLGTDPALSRISERASRRLTTLRGGGDWRERGGFLLRHLAREVTDGPSLLAMLGAGMTFRLANYGLVRGLGELGLGTRMVEVLAGAGAFSAEATAFPLYHRLGAMTAGRSVEWNRDALSRDIQSSFLFLGGLRAGGALGRFGMRRFHGMDAVRGVPGRFAAALPLTRHLFQQGGMLAGIVAGHSAEVLAGLREGQPLDLMAVESFATLLHFNAAGGLLHHWTPERLRQWERSLEMVTRVHLMGGAGRIAAGGLAAWTLADLAHPSVAHALAGSGRENELPAFLTALGLGTALGGMMLCQQQTLRQELELRQELRLGLLDIASYAALAYQRAQLRTYDRHGLNFEYAVVRRQDFPYMLAIGTPGLHIGGYRFVMEDFFLDLPQEERARLMELIAVHEYGESLFHDHHQASLLEFEVARREGFLERYLGILSEKVFLKFRDINLHRMGPELLEALDRNGVEIAEGGGEEPPSPSEQLPEFARAAELRDNFRWPTEIGNRFRVLDDQTEIAREKIEDWAGRITVNEQAKGYFNRASEEALREGIRLISPKGDPRKARSQILHAYYRPLSEFASELADGILNREHLQVELLQGTVEDARRNLRLGLARQVAERIPETSQQKPWMDLLEALPIWRRDAQEHLGWVENERGYFERYGIDLENKNPRAIASRHQELSRRLSFLVERGLAQDEDQALRMLSAAGSRRRDLPDSVRGIFDGLEVGVLDGAIKKIRPGRPFPAWLSPLLSFMESGDLPFRELELPFLTWLAQTTEREDLIGRAIFDAWEQVHPLEGILLAKEIRYFRKRVVESNEDSHFLSAGHPVRRFLDTGQVPEWEGERTLREFYRPLEVLTSRLESEHWFRPLEGWPSERVLAHHIGISLLRGEPTDTLVDSLRQYVSSTYRRKFSAEKYQRLLVRPLIRVAGRAQGQDRVIFFQRMEEFLASLTGASLERIRNKVVLPGIREKFRGEPGSALPPTRTLRVRIKEIREIIVQGFYRGELDEIGNNAFEFLGYYFGVEPWRKIRMNENPGNADLLEELETALMAGGGLTPEAARGSIRRVLRAAGIHVPSDY